MNKGQGSLEYLIIVAAVLAVAAIVVLFVTGAIGTSRSSGDLNACRAALSTIYSEIQIQGTNFPASPGLTSGTLYTNCVSACSGTSAVPTSGTGLCSGYSSAGLLTEADIAAVTLN